MALPAHDTQFLAEAGLVHEIRTDSNTTCVIFPGFGLPDGFTTTEADLLLRLQAGYPDLPPDMWWFSPAVTRADGVDIPATQATGTYFGRTWQRWSRHFTAGQWKSGIDGLESYLALIRGELDRSAGLATAR